MTRRADDTERRKNGRRVGAWRRLVLLRGPKAAVHVAMVMAEYARSKGNHLVACPTADAVLKITRNDLRTVERHVQTLVDADWLQRVGPKAHTGTAQSYQLRAPDTIDQTMREEAASLSEGMWERLINYPQPDTIVGLDESTVRQNLHDWPTKPAKEPDTNVGPYWSSTGLTGIRAGARATEAAHAARSEVDVEAERERQLAALARRGTPS